MTRRGFASDPVSIHAVESARRKQTNMAKAVLGRRKKERKKEKSGPRDWLKETARSTSRLVS